MAQQTCPCETGEASTPLLRARVRARVQLGKDNARVRNTRGRVAQPEPRGSRRSTALGLLLSLSTVMANSLKVVVAADDSDGYETLVMGAGARTLCVVDVYSSWCGPCEALSRKVGTLYNELGEFDSKFVQAKADAIKVLAEFALPARSKPLFLFIKGGKEVARMDGANPVELEKLVTANATNRQ